MPLKLAYATITKQGLGAAPSGLEIEADPSQAVPGQEVKIRVFHPDPSKNDLIRLDLSIGSQDPLGAGGVYEQGVEEDLVFQRNQSRTSKTVGDLDRFEHDWMGNVLGAVVLDPGDRHTLTVTPGGSIGVIRCYYPRIGREWTVSAGENCTQAVLALAGSLSALATVKYDDGLKHGGPGLTLIATPSATAVGTITDLYLYADPQSLFDLPYVWRTTVGNVEEQSMEYQTVQNERFTIEGSVTEAEFSISTLDGWVPDPPYAGLTLVNTPTGTRNLYASMEFASGSVSYQTRRRHGTLFVNAQGVAFVTVENVANGLRETVAVQFGPIAGPAAVMLLVEDQVTGFPVGSGLRVELEGYAPMFTDAQGRVDVSSVAPGEYEIRVTDPQGVYQDTRLDGLANDRIVVP